MDKLIKKLKMSENVQNKASDTLESENLAKTISHTHLDTIFYEMQTIIQLKEICSANRSFMAILNQQSEESSRAAFVAKMDDRPIGFIYGEISSNSLHIEYLIVDGDFRRRGIARTLL